MIDTADITARIPIARYPRSLSLSLFFASLNPEREFSSTPDNPPFVPALGSLSPSRSAEPGDGAPSENEKTPPLPAEFSPVTIGSLARGTNSGLHEMVPSYPRCAMVVPPSSSIPRAIPPSSILLHLLHPLFSYSSSCSSSRRRGSSSSGASFVRSRLPRLEMPRRPERELRANSIPRHG